MPTILRTAGSVPAVSKPLSRRPTLVRKLDEIEDGSLPTPVKRAKVTFDDNVKVTDLQEWDKSPELIQEEVRRALHLRAIGDDTGYDELKSIYDPNAKENTGCSSKMLRNYTTALLNNVATLNKSFSSLVYAILKSEWYLQEDDYVALYGRFLGNLVSAHGTFLPDVLDMLAKHMALVRPSSSRVSEISNSSRLQIRSKLHFSLQHLLRLIPSASQQLSSILTTNFPHQDDSRRVHMTYVHNLLKIISYAPELRGDILALVTDRLAKIDVQVQVDIEDLAEDIGEGLVHDLPQIHDSLVEGLEELDMSDDDSSSSEDSDDDDGETQRTKDIIRNVAKMDCILELLFRYYDQDFSAISITTRRNALETLLSQFITIILPTHRSRHTQFLLFHFAQTSPEFIDTFVGTCISTAFDKAQPPINRQAAAAYLASFVSRGSHVPASIVRDVFDYIGSELNQLRKQYEPGCRGPDLRRYSAYYSLVQALMYIFCFRWRDLEYSSDDDDSEDDQYSLSYEVEHRWRVGVKETLALNIFSTHLNPLKVCSPAIVTEFAKITNHLGIIYVYGLLETNKRIHLSQHAGSALSSSYGQLSRETALNVRRDENQHHLDEYFPFDPYHLPRSRIWVDSDYRQWRGIPDPDEEQADDSESEGDEAVDLDEGTATDDTKDSP